MALKECTKKEQANSYELEVNVDGETFGNAVNRVYKKQVKSINIPGFRKGKAPRHVIEKMYGSEVFYEDAMQDCYPDALYEAAKEAGIKIVSVETLEAIEARKVSHSRLILLLSLKWKLITTSALKLQRSQQRLQTNSLTKKLRRFVTATQEW